MSTGKEDDRTGDVDGTALSVLYAKATRDRETNRRDRLQLRKSGEEAIADTNNKRAKDKEKI